MILENVVVDWAEVGRPNVRDL